MKHCCKYCGIILNGRLYWRGEEAEFCCRQCMDFYIEETMLIKA